VAYLGNRLTHTVVRKNDDDVVQLLICSDFVEDHTNVQFLGVCTGNLPDNACVADFIANHAPSIKFTGVSTMELLVESLCRYIDRQPYVRTCLYELFSHLDGIAEPRVDLIKVILPAMKYHAQDVPVQMAGTACLYNLCRGDLAKAIHTQLLADIVDHVLDVMANSLSRQQLMKNCLLVLCHDRIL